MAEIPSVTIVHYAPLAQLDRASASDAEGQRFESSRARHIKKAPLRGFCFISGSSKLFKAPTKFNVVIPLNLAGSQYLETDHFLHMWNHTKLV